jgi:hypothetical protein
MAVRNPDDSLGKSRVSSLTCSRASPCRWLVDKMDASAGGARNDFIGPRASAILCTQRGLQVHASVGASEYDEGGHAPNCLESRSRIMMQVDIALNPPV